MMLSKSVQFDYLLKHFFLIGFVVLFGTATAQEKCGTTGYHELLKNHSPSKESQPEFEEWLQNKIHQKKLQRWAPMSTLSADDSLTIPVVVHIIHNGEGIGTGSNISFERVLSQMKVLNDDFRRLNADSTNTPAMFRSSAADTQINFVLAKRDPEGLPSNGVVRKRGDLQQYAMADNWQLKANSYWPSEDYLNIWVAPLRGNLLGFAQFPQSDTEPGLEDASAYQYTDGVVIDHDYFGLNNNVSPVSTGRSATHEIGHFLGLRHIWGDGGCDEDDFCEDTPLVQNPNYGCPTEQVTSCGNIAMFQNYMDYTNDVCMNIFTNDQKLRMRTVLENSPRRASLLTSKGAIAPVPVAVDLGIKNIISPVLASCENTVMPEVLVKNYGQDDIFSFKIRYFINGSAVDSLYQSVHLSPLDSIKINFPTTTVENASHFDFRFEIQQVNDLEDENSDNNSKAVSLQTLSTTSLPFIEDFEDNTHQGEIFNPDQQYGWEIVTADDGNSGNKALRLECYNYESNLGDKDFYFTPVFELSEHKNPVLKFSVAYAEYSGGSYEGLEVKISKDCGVTYHNEDVLFRNFGEDLASAKQIGDAFAPDGRLEWKNIELDLEEYAGLANLRIAFAGINDYGNNLYLDNIKILENESLANDLHLAEINIPPVSCTPTITPEVTIINNGITAIHDFDIRLSSVWEEDIDIQYSGLSIAPKDTALVYLPAITAPFGAHSLSVSLQNPNGIPDDFPENNQKTVQYIIDSTREDLPLRLRFDEDESHQDAWFIYNPDQQRTWELIETPEKERNQALYINHFEYEELNEKDWFVSPLLDFSNREFISLSFALSYAYNFNYTERLKVLVSTDCGHNYTTVAYNMAGKGISSTYSSKLWRPEEQIHWEKFSVPLNDFIGEENVRIAFVMENGYGNNVYMDDIEFFLSDQSQTEIPDDQKFVFQNPASYILPIAFKLEEKDDVRISIYDMRGKVVFSEEFPNTLNQKYSIDISSLPAAVYILQTAGKTFYGNKRVLIQK